MPQLHDLIKNRKIYIAKMSKWPDRKLSKHLDLVAAQIGWAWQQKNADALETLNEMWRQIIEARLNVGLNPPSTDGNFPPGTMSSPTYSPA
jgi:hypothetical protein